MVGHRTRGIIIFPMMQLTNATSELTENLEINLFCLQLLNCAIIIYSMLGSQNGPLNAGQHDTSDKALGNE